MCLFCTVLFSFLSTVLPRPFADCIWAVIIIGNISNFHLIFSVLLSAMKEWIPECKHNELELMWPPV